jgi:hypothetical protein
MKRALLDEQKNNNGSEEICETLCYRLEVLDQDLFKAILSFCDITEYHVLRFVCKSMHFISHDYNTKNRGKEFDKSFTTGKKPELINMGVIVARKGYLNILVWMKEYFPEIFLSNLFYGDFQIRPGTPVYYFGEAICTLVMEFGYLEILKWVRENNCHWGWGRYNVAALEGRFEALRAALARNIKVGF